MVAGIGVLSALVSLGLERARETAVLRAHGITPREALGLGILDAATIGTIASILALPLGLLIAWLLTGPINRRSFGWTIPLELDAATLFATAVLGVGSALVAGLAPSILAARLSPAALLRNE